MPPAPRPRPSRRGRIRAVGAVLPSLLVVACDGPQSALVTASGDAESIAVLWWWMAGAGLVIWAVVVGLAWYAVRIRQERHSERMANLLIVGGGAVFPTIVLAVLLVWSLSSTAGLLHVPRDEGLTIEVSGERWWWRVTYHVPGREPIELANEVRLPVGKRVPFRLVSPDVIHSFWIPSLHGKMDMIPGRTNYLALEPNRTGTFRGACAEYCGASHALMSLYAVVEEDSAFEAWLDHQAEPAAAPAPGLAAEGRRLFDFHGCGACHTVRGTEADGVIGPDLTHVGSRLSLAAGILPNEPEAFARWIARPDSIKPGAHMPSFRMLPDEEIRAMAAYLEGLR